MARGGLSSIEVLRELSLGVARWFGADVGLAMALGEEACDASIVVIASRGGYLMTQTVGAIESIDDLLEAIANRPTVRLAPAMPPPEAWVG